MPTNAQGGERQEEGGRNWFRTILNGLAIFFAINAASSFVSSRLSGGQTENSTVEGTVKTDSGTVDQIPSLWALGTKMVIFPGEGE
jgi:hypothetical protein